MAELRKDYILNRWVIIATERSKRPQQFISKPERYKKGVCPFCLGKENLTPPETYRVEKNGKWVVRCFPNKYAAVTEKKDYPIEKEFFIQRAAYGKHEVLVETPRHDLQLWDLPIEQITLVLETVVKRIKALGQKYVMVFKNHGEKGGTSLVHSHIQIIAYNQIPPLILEKIKATKKYKKCPYCSIVKMEAKGPRRIYENKSFAAFAPFASRFPFEVWIFPKKHVKSITEVKDMKGLAEILKKILVKLKKLNPSYNFFIHNAPKGEDLHFHIEIIPRLSIWAGFEFGSGTIINILSPEEAAKFYRR